jgi:hypothetical protein
MPNVETLLGQVRPILDLPTPMLELHDQLATIDAYEGEPSPVSWDATVAAMVSGGDPDKLIADYRAGIAATDAHRQRTDLLAEARRTIVLKGLPRLLKVHGNAIIGGTIRDTVDGLLDDARKHAAKLDKYAPLFDTARILEAGTAAELKAHQATIPLQQTFDLVLAFWRSTLDAGFTANNRHLRPDAPTGHAVWNRPDAVPHDDLRDGTKPNRHQRQVVTDVLRIATAPKAAGYRLATLPELGAVAEAQQAADLEQRTARPTARVGYLL